MAKLAVGLFVFGLAALGMASVATADSLSVSPGGTITSTSLGRLTIAGGLVSPECAVELRGSLSTGRIAKVAGVLIGAITAVAINNCTAGTSAVVLSLPWRIRYVSIAGTLPSAVVSIRHLITIFLQVTVSGISTCLSTGAITGTTAVRNIGGSTYTTGLVVSDETPIPTSGGVLCPTTSTLRGTFGLTPTQTIARL